MSAPLLDAGRVFGALTIYTRRGEAWDAEDARLIEAIANQASIAILTARLIEELDRSSAKLARRSEAQQSLLEIAARITAIREPGPLLQQVVDAAKRLVGGDGSVLDLIDPEENVLRWAYDSGIRAGFTDDEIAELTIPVGVGATGLAVAEGRVIVARTTRTGTSPTSDVNDRFFEVTGFRSMIIAPISGESGPLGALEVYSARASRVRRRRRGRHPVARLPGRDRDPERAPDRGAEPVPRRDRPTGRHRAEPARDRRPDHGDPRARRPAPARRRGGRPPARSDGAIIDLLDPVTGTIEWGYDSGIDAGAAPALARDVRRRGRRPAIARRAGDALHDRLPRRPALRPHAGPARAGPGGRPALARDRPARLRARRARHAHGLLGPAGLVHGGRRGPPRPFSPTRPRSR